MSKCKWEDWQLDKIDKWLKALHNPPNVYSTYGGTRSWLIKAMEQINGNQNEH